MTSNRRAARGARTLEHFHAVLGKKKKKQPEIIPFAVLKTTARTPVQL